MVDYPVRPRKLHERSYLTFEFPTKDNNVIRTYIPFLENCKVSESQKSNLAEYSLLGRSGSIYSYLGAKSRSVNLSFKMTFEHLINMYSLEGISRRFEQSYRLFSVSDESRFFGQESVKGINHYKIHFDNFFKTLNIDNDPNVDFQSGQRIATRKPNSALANSYPPFDPTRQKLVNLVIFWINIIRSSVRNNATNTLFGPPVVRLNHGVMYNNVPFIVDNYQISVVEEAGYDLETILPRQLEITMALNEHRVGDLDKFESSKVIKGDNIAGWESVISENNMDPYNGITYDELSEGFILDGPQRQELDSQSGRGNLA
jgi:hypothetical protein